MVSLQFQILNSGAGTVSSDIYIPMSGIYRIVNQVNGKVYIGSTQNQFHKRWYEHRHSLKTNTHCNKHLQSAWNLYGEQNFLFEAIEECSKEHVLVREQFYLEMAQKILGEVYNMRPVAGSGAPGNPISEERKKYLRECAAKQFADSIQREKHLEAVRKSNSRLSSFVLIDPDGKRYSGIVNLTKFCSDHGLNIRHIYDIKHGKRNRFMEKGWKVE